MEKTYFGRFLSSEHSKSLDILMFICSIGIFIGIILMAGETVAEIKLIHGLQPTQADLLADQAASSLRLVGVFITLAFSYLLYAFHKLKSAIQA
ncbi:MAG: hypothetical protein PHR00_01135 [Patescibacteria group bacterium]|nr:hypothetical protein [Patescibacteria group bacterium]